MRRTVRTRDGHKAVRHEDENGQLHHATKPAFCAPGTFGLWVWHGEQFKPNKFDESWPDEKKVWWMRARMESK